MLSRDKLKTAVALVAASITTALAIAAVSIAGNTGGQLTSGGGLTRVVADAPLSGSGTSSSHLVIDTSGLVPTSRTLTAGTGLTGGGSLAANRTFALADTAVTLGTYTFATVTVDQQGRITSASSGSAVPTSRTLTAGTGLTGGGDLSANRTFTLADTAVTPATYTVATITVDQQGRITSAVSGSNQGESGDGSDGTCTMDGSASCTCTSRSGSTYTATRSCFFSTLTINNGSTFKPDGWPIYVKGVLTNNGDINSNGGDASGGTDGSLATTGSRFLPVSLALGTSSSAAPQVFVAASSANGGASVGGAGSNGGAGTSGTTGRGGGGGAGGNNNPFTAQGTAGSNSPSVTLNTDTGGDIRAKPTALRGTSWSGTIFTLGTAGGAGGAGGAGTTGGGRGAAGGWIVMSIGSAAGSGTWRAKGGAGGVGTSGGAGIGGAGGGGGGSGGLIVLEISSGSAPTLDVSGGALGAGGAGGSGGAGSGGNGGAGGSGATIILN